MLQSSLLKKQKGCLPGIKNVKICQYIGCLLKRFLKDEDGDVDSIQLHCLKPKELGSGTVLEDTDHLPDIIIFSVHDVIAGPLNVIPIHGKKMDIPDYDLIENMFHKVSGD